MLYVANRGLIKPAWDRFAMAFGLGTPALAGLAAILLAGAILTSANYFARGQHPQLNLPAKASLSQRSSPSKSGGSSPPLPSSSLPTSQPTASSLSQPLSQTTDSLSASTAPLLGGLGGSTPDTSSVTSGTSSLLPATVTTPALDLQADGKQILSTDGASVTLN